MTSFFLSNATIDILIKQMIKSRAHLQMHFILSMHRNSIKRTHFLIHPFISLSMIVYRSIYTSVCLDWLLFQFRLKI